MGKSCRIDCHLTFRWTRKRRDMMSAGAIVFKLSIFKYSELKIINLNNSIHIPNSNDKSAIFRHFTISQKPLQPWPQSFPKLHRLPKLSVVLRFSPTPSFVPSIHTTPLHYATYPPWLTHQKNKQNPYHTSSVKIAGILVCRVIPSSCRFAISHLRPRMKKE